MTENQLIAFVRIWAGSMILFADFGFDSVEDIDIEDFDRLEKPKNKLVNRLLKEDPAFSTTKKVYEYVVKMYK